MADVFTHTPDFTPYNVIVPGSLCAPPVDPNLVPACQSPHAKLSPNVPELHDAAWWEKKLEGFDFHDADRIDADAFNRVLWEGIMGDLPYPTMRSGLNLRKNRGRLLKKTVVPQMTRMTQMGVPSASSASSAATNTQ